MSIGDEAGKLVGGVVGGATGVGLADSIAKLLATPGAQAILMDIFADHGIDQTKLDTYLAKERPVPVRPVE
jgi:hypothetical protein